MKSPLTTYRETHGKTLSDLGALFGVNKSTVLRWEEGGVPVERVSEIAKATGISRGELRPDIFGDAQAPAAQPEAAE
jgi:DNA-binding transcriptional regulator YdaS (Cro superfamily)